jgi:uncharacterized damage-inducible protein DinB
MKMMLLVHILAGGVGLLSGYVALYAAKGAKLHRRSGMLFVYAMLTMSVFGITIAAVQGIAPALNVPAGVVTFYLVITSLTTVRPPAAGQRRLHVAAMLLGLVVGATAMTFGFQAIANGGSRDGIPAFPYFLFGVVALLGVAGDLRVLRSGALQGTARIARHLWRMTFALFIAAMSFFIGQAKVIPQPFRIRPLLALPVLAVLVTMIYWMRRVRASERPKEKKMRIPVPAALVIAFVLSASAVSAQENPLSANNKFLYRGVKGMLLRSAELMPEEKYGFKPADSVRTFGQIVGHAADAQYTFCSAVLGEKNPEPKIEKSRSTKAELTAALKDALAYCDRAYDAMTDPSGTETVKNFAGGMPKLGVLTLNNLHSVEHYGNLVVYLRMNGLVPPTSDPEFMKQMSSR